MSKEPTKISEGDENYEATKKFADEVVLLIQTVNPKEKWAVLEYMDGPKLSNNQQLPKPAYYGESTIILGMFSKYKAALIKTDMGSKCREKFTDALKRLPNVKGLLALGIAWGNNDKGVKLADVLVATTIVGWSNEKWQNGELILRDRFHEPMTKKFKDVFAESPEVWCTTYKRAEGLERDVYPATVISTAKLINDIKIRSQVLSQEPEARGGEMEGHVLIQEIQKLSQSKPDSFKLEVAVIKGVSDFADGEKHDEWQLTAAMAAVDYAKFILDKTNPDKFFS